MQILFENDSIIELDWLDQDATAQGLRGISFI